MTPSASLIATTNQAQYKVDEARNGEMIVAESRMVGHTTGGDVHDD